MARPTKFNDQAAARYVQAVQLGATQEAAAAAAGWSAASARNYLAAGREAESSEDTDHHLDTKARRFLSFLRDVKKAEATTQQAALALIQQAARQPQHWTAAAWLLERRWPEAFGRRTVEITGKDGGPVSLEVTADQLLAELRAMNAEQGRVADHQRQRLRVVPGDPSTNGEGAPG
jgi:hypothetical protein